MIVRVRAKTSGEGHRTLTISDDGASVHCDCGGFIIIGYCSHIDAVLVAGERGMVIEEDFALADQAMTLTATSIQTPASWKASWRQNMRWRGLSRAGAAPRLRRKTHDSRPMVCFTGGKASGRTRSGWIADASANGWQTIDSVSPSTDVLVADDVQGSSAKLKGARRNGTVVVTYAEWVLVMEDGVLPSLPVITS